MQRAFRPRRFPTVPLTRAFNSGGFDTDDIRPMGIDPKSKGDEIVLTEDDQNEAFTKKSHFGEQPPSGKHVIDVDALLSKPTWSVRSLLPDSSLPPSSEITPQKLHHLLRLSALPIPKTQAEEAKMLKTLHSQLHFVRDIQKVDTEGVEPLRSIRDETEEGIQEIKIGMEDLKEAFAKEDVRGKNRRPRRRRGEVVDTKGVEDWDVLGTASETVEVGGARYFVVRSGGKERSAESSKKIQQESRRDKLRKEDYEEGQ